MTKTITKAPAVKYTSNFAILDVKSGRVALAKQLQPNGYPEKGITMRIPVTIKGFITHAHSGNDGVSIEYGVEVMDLKIEGGK